MHRTLTPRRKLLSWFDPKATHQFLDEAKEVTGHALCFKVFDLNRGGQAWHARMAGRTYPARALGNDRYGRPDLIHGTLAQLVEQQLDTL